MDEELTDVRSGTVYRHGREEMLPYLPPAASRVLDVGAADGEFGRALRTARPTLEIWGVEPDPAARADRAYDHFVRSGFPEAAESVPPRAFDAIYFNDVLEHMLRPEEALTAARALLAPDGVVIASIPNVRHVSALLPLVFRGNWTYTDTGVLDRTHVRFFTRRSAGELFTANGWRLRKLEGINRWYRKLAWIPATADFCFLQYAIVAEPVQR